MVELLPTVPGKTRGIVAVDPLTLQCGVCGAVTVNDGAYAGRDGTFLILTSWLFCLAEAARDSQSPRRCRDCQAEHKRECRRCAS